MVVVSMGFIPGAGVSFTAYSAFILGVIISIGDFAPYKLPGRGKPSTWY